jgi:hypothetical protein
MGISGTSVVGYQAVSGNNHAMFWSSIAGTGAVDLNPSGYTASQANKISGSTIVGQADNHAIVWTGHNASSAIDINPSGYSQSAANALSGSTIVGFADSDAIVWSSPSATSFTDIHPSGEMSSAANAISGSLIVGTVRDQTGPQRAAVWTSPSANSFVNLNGGFIQSLGLGVENGVIVGAGELGFTWHAVVWTSISPVTSVDINPAGFTSSYATAIRNGLIVGYGVTSGGDTHALVWTQPNATSFIDLQTYMSSGYAQSSAADVDANHTVVGYGIETPSGQQDGFGWLPQG